MFGPLLSGGGSRVTPQHLTKNDLFYQGMIQLPNSVAFGGSQFGAVTLFDLVGHSTAGRINLLTIGNSKRWPFHVWETTNPLPGLTPATAPRAVIVQDWGSIDPTNKLGLSGLPSLGCCSLDYDPVSGFLWFAAGSYYTDDTPNLLCFGYCTFDFTNHVVVLQKAFFGPPATTANVNGVASNGLKGWTQKATPSFAALGMGRLGGAGLGSRESASTAAHGPLVSMMADPSGLPTNSVVDVRRLAHFAAHSVNIPPNISGLNYSNWINKLPTDLPGLVKIIAGNYKWSTQTAPPGSFQLNQFLTYNDSPLNTVPGAWWGPVGTDLIGQGYLIEGPNKRGLLFTYTASRGYAWYGYSWDHSGFYTLPSPGGTDPNAAQWVNGPPGLPSLIGKTGHNSAVYDDQNPNDGGGKCEQSVRLYGFVSVDKLLANAALQLSANPPTQPQLEIQPYESGLFTTLGGSPPVDSTVPAMSIPPGDSMAFHLPTKTLYMAADGSFQQQGAILVWTIPNI